MSPVKDPKVELVIVMFIVPLVVNVSMKKNSMGMLRLDHKASIIHIKFYYIDNTFYIRLSFTPIKLMEM